MNCELTVCKMNAKRTNYNTTVLLGSAMLIFFASKQLEFLFSFIFEIVVLKISPYVKKNRFGSCASFVDQWM